MRILSAVDDDGDGRRTVDEKSNKQKVEIIGREERPGDGQVLGGARSLEGESAARRPLQHGIGILPTLTQVDDEVLDLVLELHVTIAIRAGVRWPHWRSNADT